MQNVCTLTYTHQKTLKRKGNGITKGSSSKHRIQTQKKEKYRLIIKEHMYTV